jgi:hypothetical protein
MNSARKSRCAAPARRGSCEGGFTLMELAVTVGITSIVLGLGTLALTDVLRLRGAQDRYNRRVASVDFLLRRIARDVRPGRAFLESGYLSSKTRAKAEKFAAGPDSLIVSTGAGVVVYRASAGKVERIEIGGDRTERGLALDAPGVKVTFDLEGATAASARSVVTTAEWAEPPAIGVSRPTLSLRLALRNHEGAENEP